MVVDAHTSKFAELAALLTDLHKRAPCDVEAMLAELIDSATRAVPGSQYAGITVVSRADGIRNAVATHPYVVALDEVQHRDRDGPCVAAAWENDIVRVDDLATEDRWPRYCASALAVTPIRSIVAFRVFHHHRESATLSFFADWPNSFTQESIEMGLIFATHTALAWNMLRRDEQFRSALASRDVIGQAKGMLMERFGSDAVQAFDLLKRLSQDTNTPLHEVAERLTSSGRHSADRAGGLRTGVT